jgi:hypothetical protein
MAGPFYFDPTDTGVIIKPLSNRHSMVIPHCFAEACHHFSNRDQNHDHADL